MIIKDMHQEALDRFARVQSTQQQVRTLSKSDRGFAVIRGQQWAGMFEEQYEHKPRIEVNKIARAIKRITSEYRQNRTDVQFMAKSEGASAEDTIADVATGLLRSNEKDSAAGEAYDNAWQEGISGGFGAWRLSTTYEDELNEDDDEQKVCFEPIYEADQCVFFDPNAKRYDKSDAEYCFVIHSLTREAYEAQYGDDLSTWPTSMHVGDLATWQWCTPDVVFIAEYYTVSRRTEKVNVYRLASGQEEEYTDEELKENPEQLDQLDATGARKLRVYSRKRRVVLKSILSGSKILEKPKPIAGRYIPVVPFYGQRWYISGVEHYAGETRHARDAQVLQNVMVSKMLETVSNSGGEKPVFIPEEVAGLEQHWQRRAIDNQAFLVRNKVNINGTEQVLPITMLKTPDMPPALGALYQVASADLQDILGKGEPPEQTAQQMSGKAIELMQSRVDEQSFVYLDNMAKSREHGAKVWLSMTKDIIRNRDTVKILGEDERPSYKKIAMPMVNQETGEQELHNDLVETELDVSVTVGPSTASKRSAIVRQLTGVLQMVSDPAQQQIITSAIMMNMQGEGLTDINEYYRKSLVQAGVVKPTSEEAQKMQEEQAAAEQNKKPDAQAEYLMASAQKQAADAEQSKAKTKNIEADTTQKMAELQGLMPIN